MPCKKAISKMTEYSTVGWGERRLRRLQFLSMGDAFGLSGSSHFYCVRHMTKGSGLLYSTGNWLQKLARAASDPRWDLGDRCVAVELIPQIERRIGVYTDEGWPDPWV